MKAFHSFIRSFMPRKELFSTFLVDAFILALIVGAFWSFGSLLTAKAYAISGGKSVEELKMGLLSGSLEYNQNLLRNIQIFTYTLIGGGILLLVMALFGFSWSRAIVWYEITKQKLTRNNYWRWNALSLILLFIFIILAGFYVVFRIVFNLLLFFINNQTAFNIINKVLLAIFLMAFLFWVFLAGHSFAQKYRVWESLGNAFHLIKLHWSNLWKAYLFSLGTLLIITVILYLLNWLLRFYPTVYNIINIVVLLLFLSWMRLYVIEMVDEHKVF